jgi:acyl-CoA thioester hydrolase
VIAREDWDLPSPFSIELTVAASEIDAYDHVNNAVYVTWFDRTAWAHSAVLGLPIEKCQALDRGMAVLRTVVGYARPALLGDSVEVGTWLLSGDSKLRVRRRFQARRVADGVTLARAEVDYACIELSSGRPTRWPAEFREHYVPLAAVERAYAGLVPL